MNKRHPYRDMEHEYITTDISLRELSRKHCISAHSLVVDQAKKGKWAEKREQYQAKESESFIEKYADRRAERQAQIHDKLLDAVDEALDKFREDLKATKLVRQPDGTIREVPAWYMKPRDMALLTDRFQVLFAKPASITQHQGVTVTSEFSVDLLREFIEATEGMEGPSQMEASPLPRARRLDG